MDHAERRALGAAPAVGVVERAAALGGDERREQRRRRRAALARQGQRDAEIAALDVLHREEQGVVGATEIERRHDVLMGERHRHPHIANEHGQEAGVTGALLPDALDDDALLHAGDAAARQVHLAHAAAGQRAHQLVAAESPGHAQTL